MAAPTPSTIQDAIVAALTARYNWPAAPNAVPPVLPPANPMAVEAHGGQFTEREAPMLLAKAPAILVSCTGIPNMRVYQTAAHWQATMRWSLVVLGADTATLERADLAVDTVFDLLQWLPQQRWGLTEARLPDADSLTADNLYTGSLNNLRVALWGVSWLQTFQTAFPVA